jgi:SWI/SNF-related matrix-associated actin-dependent regulator of chromatin subfamily A3
MDAEGFLRLKTLVRAITISRTKTGVKLPPRVDQIHHLNFTLAERESYEVAKSQSRARLEEAISSRRQSCTTYNALSLLNMLRLICNHGILAKASLEKTPQPRRSPGDVSNAIFDEVLGGATSCSICGGNLLDDMLEGTVSGLASQPGGTAWDQMVCELCISDQIRNHRLEPSKLQSDSSSPATPVPDSDTAHIIESMSTKIKALVADLSKYNDIEKR